MEGDVSAAADEDGGETAEDSADETAETLLSADEAAELAALPMPIPDTTLVREEDEEADDGADDGDDTESKSVDEEVSATVDGALVGTGTTDLAALLLVVAAVLAVTTIAVELASLLLPAGLLDATVPTTDVARAVVLLGTASVLLGSAVGVAVGLASVDEDEGLGAGAAAPRVETGMSWSVRAAVIVDIADPPWLIWQTASSSAVKSHAISSAKPRAGTAAVSARRLAPSASVTVDEE